MGNKKWTHYGTLRGRDPFYASPISRVIRVRKIRGYWVDADTGRRYSAKDGVRKFPRHVIGNSFSVTLILSTLREATKEEILQEEIDDLDVRFKREAATLGDLVLRAKAIEQKCEECKQQMEEFSAKSNRLKKRLGKLKNKSLADMQARISKKADEFDGAVRSIEKEGL